MYLNDSIPAVYHTVFSLIQHSLLGKDFRHPLEKEMAWEQIWEELQHHTIHLLAVEALVTANPENRSKYLQAAYQGTIHYHKLMRQQQYICDLFRSCGIACAVLKGAAANQYYPRTDIRCMGDIDILVSPEDYQKAKDLLCTDSRFLGENYRHCMLNREGIVIEVHQACSFAGDEDTYTLFNTMLTGCLGSAVTISQENYSFPSLPPLENGLVLLAHIRQHMQEGLGLRQFLDWMMYVENCLDDTFWFSEFAPAAQRLGIDTLAVTVTKMCQMYLGARSDISWCDSAPEDLCVELMRRTIEQGNFGRKMPPKFNSTVSVLRSARSIPEFFAMLQRFGCINWKASQRHRFLKPFAWLYQLCKYIRLGLRRKNPLGFLLQAVREESKTHTLLKKTGIQRQKGKDS